jgi:hypothetical protein
MSYQEIRRRYNYDFSEKTLSTHKRHIEAKTIQQATADAPLNIPVAVELPSDLRTFIKLKAIGAVERLSRSAERYGSYKADEVALGYLRLLNEMLVYEETKTVSNRSVHIEFIESLPDVAENFLDAEVL